MATNIKKNLPLQRTQQQADPEAEVYFELNLWRRHTQCRVFYTLMLYILVVFFMCLYIRVKKVKCVTYVLVEDSFQLIYEYNTMISRF